MRLLARVQAIDATLGVQPAEVCATSYSCELKPLTLRLLEAVVAIEWILAELARTFLSISMSALCPTIERLHGHRVIRTDLGAKAPRDARVHGIAVALRTMP